MTSTKSSSLPFLVRNAAGSTPLQIAIREGYARITQLLVYAGPSEALQMEDAVGNTPVEVAHQRDLLHRTRHGFPGTVSTPAILREHFELFGDVSPMNANRLEVEIPKLKQTVEVLTRDGKLRNGTKLANELAIFVQKMEFKLATAKAAQELTDAQKNEENATDKDINSNTAADVQNWHGTLETIKTAVSSQAVERKLVHIYDVHESVRTSLSATIRQDQRLNGGARDDRDDELEPEINEVKVSQHSALAHWSFVFDQFDGNKDELAAGTKLPSSSTN